jgi:hypothetical protein
MAEQPPLNRSYVISYAANDRDYPVIGLRLDPRVAGYRVPEDLSPHPDSKRYPNHVFTGSQPSNGDERVTHVYEILPSPYVPFTRYDDDLGPIQGRRRSVKNEGQEASLAADKKVSYEGREGSAIVSNEIEETWSIKTDEDGNSLFPLKDRDFYDPSRGAVQERRQLFVPTGEEEGTLENVNGVITQTSYEPYNEFLSVKIVQTHKVDGPQLIGRATDNDGQLVTVTTQRKGAKDYIPPNPTATRTVEVNREDAESLVERIVDTPEIFTAKTFSLERPDPIPQKFRVAVPLQSEQEIVAGDAQLPTLAEGEISRTEEQRNKFLKRTTATSRDQTVLPKTLIQKATDNDRQEVTITETLQLGDTDEVPTATKTVESEALGDGNFVVRKTEIPAVFAGRVFQKTKDDLTPQKFRGAQESNTFEQTIVGVASSPSLGTGEFAKSEQQVNRFVKRVSTTSRVISQAVTLVEKVLSQDGQVGERILTLDNKPQTIVPDALLIDASIENLGDGRTVKTETRVPQIFSATTIQKSKSDNVPEKFKVERPETTTEETISGTVVEPSLGSDDLSKSEQQISQFLKRVRTTKRDQSATGTIEGNTFTTELGGGYAKVLETYPFGGSLESPEFGTVDDQIENLGDGKRYRRKVVLDKPLPRLSGQDYDQELDIVIPYKQFFGEAGTASVTGNRKRVTPRDLKHSQVIEFDVEEAQEALDNYYWEIPDMVGISLPNKLKSVVGVSQRSTASASGSGFGDTYFFTTSTSSSSRGKIIYNIEEGFNGNIPAVRAVFFLPKDKSSPEEVLARVKAKSGVDDFFPNARPVSHEVVSFGGSEDKATSESVSFNSGSISESSGGGFTVDSTTIPPTIHKELVISSNLSTLEEGGDGAPSAVNFPNRLPATEPFGVFPTGNFLYQINSTPYRFSYVRVEAIIVKITKEYV